MNITNIECYITSSELGYNHITCTFKHVTRNILHSQYTYYLLLKKSTELYFSQYLTILKTMFGSSLPPVVCRRARILYTLLFVFVCI